MGNNSSKIDDMLTKLYMQRHIMVIYTLSIIFINFHPLLTKLWLRTEQFTEKANITPDAFG